MEQKQYSRKDFISKCLGAGTVLIGGAWMIAGCASKDTSLPEKKETALKADADTDCDDLSNVSDAEIENRKKFAYEKKSSVPGSVCGNCALFIPSSASVGCGGCLLFKGPVHFGGHCIQYAVKS